MTNFIERVRLVDANSSNKICFEVELDLSFSLSIVERCWKCLEVLGSTEVLDKCAEGLKGAESARKCLEVLGGAGCA